MTINYVRTYIFVVTPRITPSLLLGLLWKRRQPFPACRASGTKLHTAARYSPARSSSHDRFSPPLIRRSRSRRAERTRLLSSAYAIVVP